MEIRFFLGAVVAITAAALTALVLCRTLARHFKNKKNNVQQINNQKDATKTQQ
nr:hypothetical protein [uncultured Flavobacterium sp.]